MENKKATILVLAKAAAVLIAASGLYAFVGRQTGTSGSSYPSSSCSHGIGPSMMGESNGAYGGMMGTRGMMGTSYGEYMIGNMCYPWNSTSAP